MDLNLTLSDIDDEEESMPFLFEMVARPVEDIQMDEGCCHKDNSDKDWEANESTFISYLPEPD